MNIEIPDDHVDQIISEDLTWQYENLVDRLKDIDKGGSVGTFSSDREEEKIRLIEMVAAMKSVLNWYGVVQCEEECPSFVAPEPTQKLRDLMNTVNTNIWDTTDTTSPLTPVGNEGIEKSVKNERDRFDLEQDFMSCWTIIDEIDLIYNAVGDMDMPAETSDKILNLLLGLKEINQLRFEWAWKTFESCVSNKEL